jgi:hypothetical protein
MKTNDFLELFCISDFDMIPIFFDNKVVTFTTFSMFEKCSGDEFILCKVKGKYIFLKLFVDHDCDGTFYHAYFIDRKDEFDLNDFDINTDTYYNEKYFCNILNHLRLSQKYN